MVQPYPQCALLSSLRIHQACTCMSTKLRPFRLPIHVPAVLAVLTLLASPLQAESIIDFDAADITNAVNQFSGFTFNASSPTIDATSSSGYSGQPVYCAFQAEGDSFLAGSPASGSGLKLRWNAGNGTAGETSSGLFLFKKDDFLNDLNSGVVSMDAANDSVQLTTGWINEGTLGENEPIASASVRFVLKDSLGYHISDPQALTSSGQMTMEATELTYFSYAPFVQASDAAGTLGSASSPSFDNIEFAGFRLDVIRGSQTSLGVNVGLIDFKVAARHQPIALSLDPDTRYQTMEGFGASGAWYENNLRTHDQRDALIELLFVALDLDIYRLRNVFDQGTPETFSHYINKIDRDAEIIALAEAARQRPLKILMSGWSPPAYLKSNAETGNGGTLAKDANGDYRYEDYAQWWDNSLQYYASAGIGIEPDYVSMQNEPNWTATHDSNLLDLSESATRASYDLAFGAVWTKFNTRMGAAMPKMLGPETIALRKADEYIDSLSSVNRSRMYGYAHHLYQDDVYANPDVLLSDMAAFQAGYGDKPIFQSEYAQLDDHQPTPWVRSYNLAKLMHNSLAVEGVSAYFYWALFWNGEQGLVTVPGESSAAYTIHPEYYAFKHYSAFIRENWQRIESHSSKSELSQTAFINPDGDQISMILLNPLAHSVEFTPQFNGYQVVSSRAHRSSQTENCLNLGDLTPGAPVLLPANSITTLSLDIEVGNAAPVLSLETPEELTLPADVGLILEASVSDDALPDTSAPTTVWSVLSAPAGGSAHFDDATQTTTGVSFDLAGEYVLQLSADDSEQTSSRSIVVHYATGDQGASFTSQDIGSVGLAGSVNASGQAITLAGSGGDIWNSADEFHFYHSPLEGDGSLTARIVSQENTNPWAKAGLMIRDSLNANSTHGFIAVTPANGLALQSRLTTGAGSNNSSGGGFILPLWLKIERSGTLITVSHSSDGTNWTAAGTLNPNMSGADYIGFAVTSHDNGQISGVVFDNFESLSQYTGASISLPPHANLTVGGTHPLSATVSDPNQPTEQLTYQWLQSAGSEALPPTPGTSLESSVTPQTAGEYTFRLIVDDGEIKTFAEQALTVQTELTAWQIEQFGDDNAPEAALLADPNHNGLVNLLEFAFGGDPLSTAPGIAPLLPEQHILPIDGQDYLSLTFRRRGDSGSGTTASGYTVDGIIYTVQTTLALSPADWQSGSQWITETGAPSINADGTENVTVRLVEPIDGSTQPQAFMRLKVSEVE